MSSGNPDELAARLASLAQSMAPYQGRMISALTALCRIPSVKGPAVPEAPYGVQTALALAEFLNIGRQLGFRAVNLDNRAGYVEYGQGRRLIAVLAHLDIVPAGEDWQTPPFEPAITADRFIARGAADDKGPLVAALFALKALADEGFRPDARLRIITGLDEESGSSCMEHYVKVEELPAAGFTPDAQFPVINAEKGNIWLDLTIKGSQPADAPLRLVEARSGLRPNMVPGSCILKFARASGIEEVRITGRPAHASTPWNGLNAIALAMRETEARLAAAGCSHPFVDFFNRTIGSSWRGEGLSVAGEDSSGPLTLNAGQLNLDDQGARLTLDIRYPVTWTLDQVLQAIRKTAGASGAHLEIIRHSSPLYYPADSPLVSQLSGVYSQLTGLDAAPVSIGGGTYARTMPNIVAFGPIFPGEQETAHQAGEFILTRSLFAGAAIYRQAMRRLAES